MQTYHKSFRQTFLYLNLMFNLSALCHPAAEFIEHYLWKECSSIYYCNIRLSILLAMSYIDFLSVYFMQLKFFILAFERLYAFRRRSVYEHLENRISAKIIGTVVFKNIGRILKYYRRKSQTLTESFEIKQTENINKIMWPVLKAGTILATTLSPAGLIIIHQAFCRSTVFWSSLYYTTMNLNYVLVALYAFFSTTYVYYNFGILGKTTLYKVEVLKDVTTVTAEHFSTLRAQWKSQ
ncbi:unnamed protein product [Bursaphelenchus okinawaensis]|uniref:G_PROTEIN_RECEP_F1_2 domain-containing protein n=1 Tax=Bursaphelenchus okinawaensis TaxID=465554 RepID=A0A811JQF4_9BILA|nr:unnamed protein product [Bursaphelenchus okinawaensis]CAG9078283.1 unnamed protein product [Bursaphelenchus okinawaensis]